jgi:hypothetical protein
MSARRLIPVIALLCAVALPASASGAIPAADRAKLHRFALEEAKLLHEKHPTGLRAVRTTWGKVKAAFRSGPRYRAKRVVYVLHMNGQFVDRGGNKHARDNIVYDGKTIKPLVSYFDFALPSSLGTPSRV